MAWTKAKTAILIGMGLLLAGTTTVLLKEGGKSGIDTYISDRELVAFLNAPPLLAIQQTHFPRYVGTTGATRGNKSAGRDWNLRDLIAMAYGVPPHEHSRIIFPADMPTQHYDFLVTVPEHPYEQLQAEIKRRFSYTARKETRDVDVLVMKVASSGAGKLKVTAGSLPRPSSPNRYYDLPDQPISKLASSLESMFQQPVVDQTGLTNHYDMTLQWNWEKSKDWEANRAALKKALLEEFGLDFTPGREPVEMLVVEKAQQAIP